MALDFLGIQKGIYLEDSNGNKVYFIPGDGNPESVVSADPGSVYLDVTNGKQYVKETGTGNTGWERIATYDEVLAAQQGLDPKDSCRAATTANLSATYSGTPNFTLTADSNGAISIDGVHLH